MENFDLKKYLAENKLIKENYDGVVEHHLEQIDDDLMYGEFPTMVEVDGFLDDIIRGIEEIRIRYKSITDEHGDEGGFDEDREYDDEFSTK